MSRALAGVVSACGDDTKSGYVSERQHNSTAAVCGNSNISVTPHRRSGSKINWMTSGLRKKQCVTWSGFRYNLWNTFSAGHCCQRITDVVQQDEQQPVGAHTTCPTTSVMDGVSVCTVRTISPPEMSTMLLRVQPNKHCAMSKMSTRKPSRPVCESNHIPQHGKFYPTLVTIRHDIPSFIHANARVC